MPTAKGKGGSSSHRYRPASEYDDTTLAQKREYWRTKKREQRARLSERRGKPTQDRRTEKLLHLTAPAAVNSSVSCSFATPSFRMQSNHDMYKPANVSSASQSGNTVGDRSPEATQHQKAECLQTMELNKVSLQLPASCSMSAEAAGGNTATLTSRSAGDAVSRALTSPTPSGNQINSSSSVPPVRVTRITNGSSAKTAPQPCVSMQGTSVPKMQQEAQVALCIQPKLTTQEILVSSPCCPVSIKTEGKAANRTPQSTAKSALGTTQRAKGIGNSHPTMESEEERAAKRREHWRIKKREQRAKLAARIAKARERTQAVEVVVQRQTAQKTGLESSPVLQHFSSQPFLKAAGQRQGPIRVKASLTPAKRVNNKLQSGAAGLTAVNLQMNQIQNPHESRTTQTTTAPNSIFVKKSGESLRKFPSYVHLSNVTRGFARCKTPRQKFIEAQKNFMNQRIIRCKSLLPTVVCGSRIIPRIDPNLTTEQIIAKRREYWRIKKREQRAKLSMEVRARLKEKDSLMRRVKRYQRILEDMRKARAMTQAAGSTLTHASETIGGFIKEDGTLTINIPQDPPGPHPAPQKTQERHAGSNHIQITQPQQQSNTKRRGSTAVKLDQPPTVFHPAQVKLSLPLSGQLANKSARLLSVRPRIQLERTTVPNSHSSPIPAVGQLTLTHPQTPQNTVSGGSTAGSHLSGCVMKMTVSTSAPSIPTLSLDPELTEEERMAKKREYWRIKKREQRAARAARLKQGSLQARANAVLQRRKAHRQLAVSPLPVSRILTSHTGSTPPLTKNSVPVTPNSNDIKQENESIPTVDLNSEPDHAICPDIKPPTSPPPSPSPVSQPESDAALSADSQATTLLAVASMKKLLEESLSTVGECKSEETDIKTEITEELSDSEITPNLPQLFFEKDDVDPIAADLTLQIKSWQPDTDILMHKGLPSQETPPPLSASSEVVLHPTCDHSSQTSSNVILSPPIPASDGPSSLRRAQRLRNKKGSLPNCRSPEPPRLHHLPMDQFQQHIDQQSRVQEQRQNRNLPSAQRQCSVGTSQSSWSSLQQKREYWKLMKRQQRARLKARQKQRQGDRSSHLSPTNIQASGLVIINTVKGVNTQTKPVLQLKPPVASPATVTSIPTVLVVSPATCNTQQTPDTLQVSLPVTGVPCSQTIEQSSLNTNPPNILSNCLRAENQQQAGSSSQRWMPEETEMDPSTCLPTLEPPENPLSSISLQPIEPPGQTPSSTLTPMKITCSQLQNPSHVIQSPAKLVPMSTLVPPKPIPGESQEDFLKRKREYWRIKKKEQRARKAIRDKGIRPKRVSNNLRPILPAEELPMHVLATQDSGQWMSSSDDSEHLMSSSVDPDTSFPHFTVPLEDEPELLLSEYENNSSEEGSVSDAVWRNLYLMDYDPLNQLLVCMVCGELQYSHNLEGVRAHIDEAHPDTLTLEPGERKRILEAWDEQVSQRERFFTSQLQQHSGSMAEAHGD
ncbi:uncharacterized protein LOC115058806 [Echeneis naucrates]|uniref:uncharacterized protein LOC115058806 n=1 Tax=Echeneis naucrates TaxID=173247 RepID=UPI0011142F25|nr:uncharacterized protein LOC115058806 [Echeneis naucrates]XP_029382189.1 uncharacterized protein LOC115058806 [Echeneis naucrates]